MASPITTTPVGARDVVFIQRANDNSVYGEVHISGSLVIFYTDENGNVTADKSGSFYTKFPTVGYTGTLKDSTSTVIADVVNGLITQTYY